MFILSLISVYFYLEPVTRAHWPSTDMLSGAFIGKEKRETLCVWGEVSVFSSSSHVHTCRFSVQTCRYTREGKKRIINNFLTLCDPFYVGQVTHVSQTCRERNVSFKWLLLFRHHVYRVTGFLLPIQLQVQLIRCNTETRLLRVTQGV